MGMTRKQYWFVVGTAFFVVVVFPFVVALTPGAGLLCADQVETFDGASAEWRWLPPGIECHISLENGEESRFVMPWQEPSPAR